MPPVIRGLTPLIQVFDMAKSVAFYRDVLGFAVISTSGGDAADSDWVMLRLNDSTLMLNTAYERDKRPPAPDPVRVKAHQDTTFYFGCDSADELYEHLHATGWNAQPPKDAYYGMRQVYTKDPDGFEVCFQHPVKPAVKV
jgi:glyoxylase I family protein